MESKKPIYLVLIQTVLFNTIAIIAGLRLGYHLLYRKKAKNTQYDINQNFTDEEQIYFTEEELKELTQDLKVNLECSIEGSKLLINPAIMHIPMISKYGHTYESNAITTWLGQKQICPITKYNLTSEDLVLNKNLFYFIKYLILKQRYNKDNEIDPISDEELLSK
jgi:hypothetical protein